MTTPSFKDLQLIEPLLKALDSVGYEQPSPIQEQSIPPLLEGKDILGVAQTGTGKTAAFALPLLSNINPKSALPQVIVLTPTRELAIQVAEAFQKYAAFLKGFHVLPIYGGQDMRVQLRALKRPVQVVVGTPGRVMDHLRKGSLDLSDLKTVVLDEADEMLRMGFIDDVEWILEHTPAERQVALFSATMPAPIQKVTKKYLKNPVHISITPGSTTVERIEQRYLLVQQNRKMDAITRIFEVESFDAAIVFVRTKTATVELADKLEARGYAAAPINGDLNQTQREKTINGLKKGKIDILIATDVAARGLDVDRISHVINYDIPYDSEAYVHRIGRTGRAGREGKAILIITPREQRLLRTIENATKSKIQLFKMPSAEEVSATRIAEFKEQLISTIAETTNKPEQAALQALILDLHENHDLNPLDIATTLAWMAQQENPLFVESGINDFLLDPNSSGSKDRGDRGDRGSRRDRGERSERGPRNERGPRSDRGDRPQRNAGPSEGMITYRVNVGRKDGVGPGDIVGAIANEGNINSSNIGHIRLADTFTTVELPKDLAASTLSMLKKVRVKNRELDLREWSEKPPRREGGRRDGQPSDKGPRNR